MGVIKNNLMWLINWILLVGVYIFITVVMLFQVKGWFGYIVGTICLGITGVLIHLWIHWPTETYTPKQSLVKKKPVKRGRYY